MVAKVAGSRATTVGKSADVLVVGVPSEWFNANSEISPIAEIVAIVPEPGQVWFVCANPNDVATAARIVQSAVEDGAWTSTRPRYLDATEDVGGAVGDLVGDLLAREERVVVSDAAGAEPVRWAIRRASGYAGIPLLTIGPQREVYVDQLKAATSSLVLGALRFALTAKPSDPSTTSVELHERGFTTLVKAGPDDTYERTLLLDALLADLDLARSSDYSSACADLLERRGFPEDARRLRDATQYWIQQRLWDANFVPEMVLHNEAHSAAVDRNIAGLCEPLLERGHLDDVDLMVLAAAAWLHDWGHASVRASGMPMATHPSDVRKYHGIFSAALLAKRGAIDTRHRLDLTLAGKGLLAGVYPADGDSFAKDVALLCGHHQGWTSCSDAQPKLAMPDEPENLPIAQLGRTGGFDVLSFDEDHSAYLAGRDLKYFGARGFLGDGFDVEKARAADLKRAKLRLAILRVADAADVGVHRVPNYRTQQHLRDTIAADYLGRAEGTITRILRGRQEVPDELRKMIGRIKQVVGDGQLQVQERVRSGEAVEEAHVDKIFDSILLERHWLLEEGNPYPEGLDEVWRIARDAYTYAKHLVAQQAYFEQHELVRAVLPVLQPSGDRFRLVVHVVPNPTPSLGKEESVKRAVRGARGIVAREWGSNVDAKSGIESESDKPSDRAKREIGIYLKRAEVTVEVDGSPVLPPPDFKLPEFDGEGSPRILPTRVLPHADGDWLIGRTDGVHRSAKGSPVANSPVVASSLRGERIATILGSGILWLHNTDCRGHANEFELSGLAEPEPPVVLAIGADATVLLTSQRGATEYGFWSNIVVSQFEAPDSLSFVKGFLTPAGPLLVDSRGGVHGDDTRFAGTRVADLDVIEWNRDVWTAMLPVGGNAVRVTCWRDAASHELPPVTIPRSPNVRIAWARGTSAGPPTLTIAADSTVERRRLAADGSGWEE